MYGLPQRNQKTGYRGQDHENPPGVELEGAALARPAQLARDDRPS